MRTIIIEAPDKSYNDVINSIKNIQGIEYYEDDYDDTIFTKEDEIDYNQAKKELENGEAISLDEYIKKRNINV